jgi:iron complex transport system ATP-binding protein
VSILSAENLSVRLGDKRVLNSVSAAFAPGLVTAVVGPNGAGKSTLLDCLAALRKPDAGRVTLDGRALRELPSRERARRIAYLPQNAEIAWAVDGRTFVGLGRTPYVGAWGLTAQDWAAVDRALTVTGVQAFADRVVSSLSGGERARVLIARALAGDPQWLLADEPLAGLDPGHVLDACDLFRRLADEEGRGVILTLHDLDAALRVADRVIVLAEGQVLADGAPAEALSPAVLRAAYGVEARTLDGLRGPVLEMVGRAR